MCKKVTDAFLTDPKLIARIRNSVRERDLLRRAVGRDKGLRVLDATAGLCRDALRLAYWGHSVWACERNAKLATLIQAALAEARSHEFYAPWIDRLKFIPKSTEEFLAGENNPFDIVVIDPMFSDEGRSALPKKDLQFLGEIVGHEDNAATLLPLTLQHARKKVLLKRPLKNPVLTVENTKPIASFKGRAHRWDVYVGTA